MLEKLTYLVIHAIHIVYFLYFFLLKIFFSSHLMKLVMSETLYL